MASTKKPSLAEVSADAAPPSDPMLSDDDTSDYDAAVDELAEDLGVGDDKLENFRASFKAAVLSVK